jgi:hypothetical protein
MCAVAPAQAACANGAMHCANCTGAAASAPRKWLYQGCCYECAATGNPSGLDLENGVVKCATAPYTNPIANDGAANCSKTTPTTTTTGSPSRSSPAPSPGCVGTIADCSYLGLCKDDKDFVQTPALKCKSSTHYLLSFFTAAELGKSANADTDIYWKDVTCEKVANKRYVDTVTGENKEMADTLEGWSTRCCGGREKARLPCASAAGLAPMWALMLAASIGVAVLQMP